MKKILAIACVAGTLASCTTTERGTAIGAASGAVIGGAVSNSWGGAAVGAVAGGLVGAAVGESQKRRVTYCTYYNRHGRPYRARCR